MDIYLVAGTDREPTQFDNDMQFNKQTQFVLSSQMFPTLSTFTIAARVQGLEYYNNVYNLHNLVSTFNIMKTNSMQ